MALPYATINQLEKAIKENVSTQEIADTVNRAIQEGKISVPQNINIEDLPRISHAIEELTKEDIDLVKGKVFYYEIDECVCYPVDYREDTYEDTYYVSWIFFGTAPSISFISYYSDDGEIWYVDEYNGAYNLSEFKPIYANRYLPENPTELTSLQIGDTRYKVFNPEDSGLFVTDNMHYGYDGEIDKYFAYFKRNLSSQEYEKIPDSGLAIIMFNTTCVCIPYVKNQENRFICNAICDNSGTSMTARAKLVINEGIGIHFDENYAQTLDSNMMNQPYCVVRFIGI